MAGVSIASVGVVCSRDEIQGDAGGAAEILLGQDNAEIVTGGNIAINAQTASLGLCNNVNDRDTHQQSSYPRTSNQLGSLEELIRLPVITPKARQYFKKKSRKLCRKLHRSQTGDRKVSSFDFQQHHYPRTNEDDATPTVARSLPNRGHSPTKEEVKKKNQHLLEENLRLKKDFHKANHRLKTLLADKRDLLRRLRLESKTSNNLIESIQAEANDTINRARDILAEANRTKIRTELLKDEIETSQDVLLRERQDLRKQSARLKKQAARMTETLLREFHDPKKASHKYFSVSKSEFSWEHCPERIKRATLGVMAVNDVAESALGGCTRNVQTGNRIHLSSAAAISDAKRNHLFDRSAPSKKKSRDDGVKTTGIFLQFDKALQRALLEVGVRGEWDC